MSFGLKIFNGDLVIEKGKLKKVEGTEKLVQDLLKILTTKLGANQFFPFYGSLLGNSTIGEVEDNYFTESVIENQIRSSIETLQKLQQAQQKSGQKVNPAELIAGIKNISVKRSLNDPRIYNINILMLAKDFNSIPVDFSMSL